MRAGALPAVDGPTGSGGAVPSGSSDLDAASAVISYVQSKVKDIDRALSARERSECAAFGCLVESKLNAAVLFGTWCEWHSLKHLRVRCLRTVILFSESHYTFSEYFDTINIIV